MNDTTHNTRSSFSLHRWSLRKNCVCWQIYRDLIEW